MTQAHAKKNTGATKAQDGSFLQKAVRSFLRTLAVGAGLLLIASLAVYFLPDPDPAIQPVALILAPATAFIGGMISGRIHRSAPAVCGLTNGCLLLALMLLLSLFFRSMAVGYSVGVALLLHALIPVLSVMGALLGVRKKPKTKRK